MSNQQTLSLEQACEKGLSFQMEGRLDLAEDLFLRVLAADPKHPHALYLYGNLALQTGRLDIAADTLSMAVACWPGLIVAWTSLGKTWHKLKRLPQAIDAFRQALALAPSDVQCLEQIVELKRLVCDWQELERYDAAFLDAVAQGLTADPFKALIIADNPAAQLAAARNAAKEVRQRAGTTGPRQRRPISDGVIKIGYLCADFHDHPLAVQYAKVPALHDRTKFHVTAYVQNGLTPGSAGQEAIDDCDAWLGVLQMTPWELAKRIDSDGIDILIDLSGFTTAMQKEVPLLTSAPVTVNYFGWPGSMGDLCDVLIADPIIIPEGSERYYDERVFRLPTTYQPNDPERSIGPTPPRAEEGLPENGFVLACFVQPTKITPAIFAAWMTILSAVPNSVLWLWRQNEWMEANLKKRACDAGIDPARLIFAQGKPREAHTARYRLVDLALDTPVYGGHSTTSDALWAGCAVLGLMGRAFPARVSASLLEAAGLSELICSSMDDYVAMAVLLAREPDRLTAIRQRLNRDDLPLFDVKRFTSELDGVLLEIATQARQGGFG
jgi:predicted O-linked N-acetylglucosamine transferase (SPINDLY family)